MVVGTVVWAHTSKTRYDKGFIAYKGTKMYVDLYDGSRVSFDLKEASNLVLPDIPTKAQAIEVGTRVIAKLKKKPGYYSGTVAEIDITDPMEPRYHVTLDDGENTWASLYHLRLLQKEVRLGGK